jgi:putative flippase GtrA
VIPIRGTSVVQALLRLFATTQFVTFLAVGGTAALVNFLSGAAVRLCGTSYAAYAASVALGFALGTGVSFVLNRRFTFRAGDQPVVPQAVRFGVVALGSILLGVIAASAIFAAWDLFGRIAITRGQAESVGHLGAIGICTVYNFLAMKFFAFAKARS